MAGRAVPRGRRGRRAMERGRWALPAALALVLALLLSGCGESTNTSTGGAGGGQGAPPAAGAYPTPQEETFQGCPPQGDGGDTDLNLLKNRIDTGNWQPTTVADLLALTWPPGIEKARRASWPASDGTQIAQNEGRPVVVEGTLLLARHEGPESPNCHDQSARDFHMWLAASAEDSRANAVVVEVTPRVRAQHPNWQPDSQITGLAGHHVRISGWVMMDQEHPEQLHKTRGTLWEVHPVMKIEVEQGGQWVDLDGSSLRLQPVGSLGNTGSRAGPQGNNGSARSPTKSGGSKGRSHTTKKKKKKKRSTHSR